MQRKLLLSAYLFFCVAAAAQQYPFVHYTPKDGLLSSRVRNIYQDSKGLLYFTTPRGLSVYDGARFTNYTMENGLANDLVNCVMEMGDDSIWVVTNTSTINCLVKGKIKKLVIKDPLAPVINQLCRDEKGNLYAAADGGLFLFQHNSFLKLPFTDIHDRNLNTYISYLIAFGNYLLVTRDHSLVPLNDQNALFLYSINEKKIVAQTGRTKIFSIGKAPDGRIWVSTDKTIQAINTDELKKGNLVFDNLPVSYKKITGLGIQSIFFDRANNCWLTDGSNVLTRCNPSGETISFSTPSGLSSADISDVLKDKEGITWISTNDAGVDKLMRTDFALFEKASGLSAISNLFYLKDKNELILYSYREGKAIWLAGNNIKKRMNVIGADKISRLIETPNGVYGISEHVISKMNVSGSSLYPETVFIDTVNNRFTNPVIDRNGNIILFGEHYVTAVSGGKYISRKKINYFSDQPALDTNGNIWIASRSNELVMFTINPGDPENYLEQKMIFKKELAGINPRSLAIDRNNIFWIGSRSYGLFAFRFQNGILTRLFHLTAASGLSDNFVTYLAADADNNIWACSPAGLDMISIKNGVPVIENITKQNNIYQSVSKVVIDKNKTVWGLLSNGLIKITSENKQPTGYSPTLMISTIKAGKDSIFEKAGASLSYKQNNLSFNFAATSFLDEKQVLYSYRLNGGSNIQWSEPSNNASVSFIDLHPGDYTLDIKASFPAGRYPEQTIQYKFSIASPWRQTWWFMVVRGLLIIGLLIIVVRFYYRRKLEKHKAVLEKQQAIEKERTRIATDLHDDLGAGLSRIKFLSETIGIKKQQQQPVEEYITKIREYSHEMIDKMGEIVWALNEKNDTLSDLLSYTRVYAVEYLSQNGIQCRVTAPENFSSGFVSGEFRRNVYLTVKETLHNVVKHAQASEVIINIETGQELKITIRDNGTGFDKNNIRPFSNGITNMQNRIKEINGKFEIKNNNGTLVEIRIPLPC